MTTKSRTRRAAKRRERKRNRNIRQAGARPAAGPPRPPQPDPRLGDPPSAVQIEQALTSVAHLIVATSDRSCVEECSMPLVDLDERYPGLFDPVVESLLERLVGEAWQRGWQPADLAELIDRRLGAEARPLLVIAIGAEHRRYRRAAMSPHWRGQLARIGLSERSEQTPTVREWMATLGRQRRAGLRFVVELTGILLFLPRLPRTEPLPGTYSARGEARRRDDVDDRVLGRVRGLLAKAEATDFAEEAEALSAKAQELMAKYSLDRALVDATRDAAPPDGPAARRIWVEQPYVSAKASLVSQVATANRCRAVCYDKPGFVVIVGAGVDLQLTELLVTSLLVQASRAMLAAGAAGHARTRSFRHSFLVAYACRIGERLQATAQAAEEAAAQASAGQLLPVLAARSRQVDERFAEWFPRTSARETHVSNGAGWDAGTMAADLANLNISRPISAR